MAVRFAAVLLGFGIDVWRFIAAVGEGHYGSHRNQRRDADFAPSDH